MSDRWRILALLFAVRTAMAFQFQSISALAPLVQSDLGIGLADLGLLIGLYLAPGIALAWPGGDIGRRFGDKPVVIAGLVAMIAGALLMAMSPSWPVQIAGRLLAGIGGIMLNVLMSKMVADWFTGREIATAMAIFVNSWPIGIALALIILPTVAASLGLPGAHLCSALVVTLALLALAALYRSPPQSGTVSPHGKQPQGAVLLGVIIAGSIWGLYNAAFGMIFGFGPTLLVERGWTLAAASSATSIVLWVVAIAVPIGGIMTDRTGRPQAVLIGSCLSFALLMLAATRIDAVVPIFVALGIAAGLPAGAILSLPARILPPEMRAAGMGVFFTLFYVFVVLAPWIGGWLAGLNRTAAITFDMGAAMLVLCCIAAALFQRQAGKARAAAAA